MPAALTLWGSLEVRAIVPALRGRCASSRRLLLACMCLHATWPITAPKRAGAAADLTMLYWQRCEPPQALRGPLLLVAGGRSLHASGMAAAPYGLSQLGNNSLRRC